MVRQPNWKEDMVPSLAQWHQSMRGSRGGPGGWDTGNPRASVIHLFKVCYPWLQLPPRFTFLRYLTCSVGQRQSPRVNKRAGSLWDMVTRCLGQAACAVIKEIHLWLRRAFNYRKHTDIHGFLWLETMLVLEKESAARDVH